MARRAVAAWDGTVGAASVLSQSVYYAGAVTRSLVVVAVAVAVAVAPAMSSLQVRPVTASAWVALRGQSQDQLQQTCRRGCRR